jgi:sec-independent protein translocase protein TatB
VLDIGWTEILVITVIALFVVGPKEIPKALKTVGIWVGKLKSLSREFQNTVEDAVRDSELDEVKKQIESAKTDFTKGMTETIDSEGELTEMLRGVDVKEEKEKKASAISSAWPIPLNKKEEVLEKKTDEDINKTNESVEGLDKDKENPTT